MILPKLGRGAGTVQRKDRIGVECCCYRHPDAFCPSYRVARAGLWRCAHLRSNKEAIAQRKETPARRAHYTHSLAPAIDTVPWATNLFTCKFHASCPSGLPLLNWWVSQFVPPPPLNLTLPGLAPGSRAAGGKPSKGQKAWPLDPGSAFARCSSQTCRGSRWVPHINHTQSSRSSRNPAYKVRQATRPRGKPGEQ